MTENQSTLDYKEILNRNTQILEADNLSDRSSFLYSNRHINIHVLNSPIPKTTEKSKTEQN